MKQTARLADCKWATKENYYVLDLFATDLIKRMLSPQQILVGNLKQN